MARFRHLGHGPLAALLVLVMGASFAAGLVIACGAASVPDDDDSIPLPDRVPVDTALPDVLDASGPIDAADAADAAPPSFGVFVSSMTTDSDLQGLDGADSMCQTLAMGQGLPGKWVAWLSAHDIAQAADRVTSPGPWLLRTGDRIAASKAALTSGTLEHAIDHDETGSAVAATKVWTGSGADGTYLTNDCDGWHADGTSGRVGLSNAADMTWTSADIADCTSQHRLYCFQN